MKRLTSMICAAAVAMSTGSFGVMSAGAQPMPVPGSLHAPSSSSNVIQVQQEQNRGVHPRARGGNQSSSNRGRDARQRGENRQRSGNRQRSDNRQRAQPSRNSRQAQRGSNRGGFERRGDRAFYRGHRGHRQQRPGYRQHQGWWFPPAAFVAGAIVGGAIGQSQSAPRGMSQSHVDWCYDRYRSYRASDNTFQPYNGPRRACNSPYG